MHKYKATIYWQQQDNDSFAKNSYSRRHEWEFDGGLVVPAAASPQVVPEQFTDSSAVDPEEAFVASISSCHMLWFLSLAAKKGHIVTHYKDTAEGIMQKNKKRKLAITEVILRPVVRFNQSHKPDSQTFDKLHHQAHQLCFIAHSVKTDIIIKSQLET